MWLRLCIGPSAFGNALGQSMADNMATTPNAQNVKPTISGDADFAIGRQTASGAEVLANGRSGSHVAEFDTRLLAALAAADVPEPSGVVAVNDADIEIDSGGLCFLAGTLIHAKDGLKAIESIRAGDWVAARHQANINGPVHWREVLITYQYEDKLTLELSVLHADGMRETLSVTNEHPFFVNGSEWKKAEALSIGDQLHLLNGGVAQFAGLLVGKGFDTVYNFAVDGDHTYFVGMRGIWAHNQCVRRNVAPIVKAKSGKLATLTDATPYDMLSGAVIGPSGIDISSSAPGDPVGQWIKEKGIQIGAFYGASLKDQAIGELIWARNIVTDGFNLLAAAGKESLAAQGRLSCEQEAIPSASIPHLEPANDAQAGAAVVLNIATVAYPLRTVATMRGSNSVANLESLAARRSYLNDKFGRTGDLDRDINYRGVVENLHSNADSAAEFAVGTPRTYGRFGTKAHNEFERLNVLTNQRIVGTDYSIVVEQFRGPSVGGGPGLVTTRRAAGSMGIDALVQYRNIPQIGFDLKTGRGWSPSTVAQIQLRFGVPIKEIYTK